LVCDAAGATRFGRRIVIAAGVVVVMWCRQFHFAAQRAIAKINAKINGALI
jgi:hypothetical protein